MAQNKSFAAFILTHGRPGRVITYDALRKQGYSGPIFLICDDSYKSLQEYKRRYGDQVIVFSKSSYKGQFDLMDNFDGDKVIVFARNACYDIARQLGLEYFFEYEDDYVKFKGQKEEGISLKNATLPNMDLVFEAMIGAIEATGVETIAFAQVGEMIGGAGAMKWAHYKRKAMNSFVFKVHADSRKDTKFIGRMNDDVNTYVTEGKRGKVFIQVANILLQQRVTQSNAGGNTEAYAEYGTYVKSFYSVMAEPSCVKISAMGNVDMRIHHHVNWRYAVPKILAERLKKTRDE